MEIHLEVASDEVRLVDMVGTGAADIQFLQRHDVRPAARDHLGDAGGRQPPIGAATAVDVVGQNAKHEGAGLGAGRRRDAAPPFVRLWRAGAAANDLCCAVRSCLPIRHGLPLPRTCMRYVPGAVLARTVGAAAGSVEERRRQRKRSQLRGDVRRDLSRRSRLRCSRRSFHSRNGTAMSDPSSSVRLLDSAGFMRTIGEDHS